MEMKEVRGNIWSYRSGADWTVITTNGTVKRDGCAVMGRGTALQAAWKYPMLPKRLGEHIQLTGNGVHVFTNYRIIAMPVKHQWWEKADLKLIEESAQDLAALSEAWQLAANFYMPRPGCGNGQLVWKDVRPVIADILDDRFTVVEINP